MVKFGEISKFDSLCVRLSELNQRKSKKSLVNPLLIKKIVFETPFLKVAVYYVAVGQHKLTKIPQHFIGLSLLSEHNTSVLAEVKMGTLSVDNLNRKSSEFLTSESRRY